VIPQGTRKEDQAGWQHHYRFRRTLHRNPIIDGEAAKLIPTRAFQKQRDSQYDIIRHLEPPASASQKKLALITATASSVPTANVEGSNSVAQQ
jgi:hypothetical protein